MRKDILSDNSQTYTVHDLIREYQSKKEETLMLKKLSGFFAEYYRTFFYGDAGK